MTGPWITMPVLLQDGEIIAFFCLVSLSHSLPYLLIHSLTHSLTHSFTRTLTPSFTLTHSHTHSLPHSFIHSHTHSHSLTHSLILSTHSLTQSLPPYSHTLKARPHYTIENDSSPIQNVFMRPHINPLSLLQPKSPEEVAWQANETTPVRCT